MRDTCGYHKVLRAAQRLRTMRNKHVCNEEAAWWRVKIRNRCKFCWNLNSEELSWRWKTWSRREYKTIKTAIIAQCWWVLRWSRPSWEKPKSWAMRWLRQCDGARERQLSIGNQYKHVSMAKSCDGWSGGHYSMCPPSNMATSSSPVKVTSQKKKRHQEEKRSKKRMQKHGYMYSKRWLRNVLNRSKSEDRRPPGEAKPALPPFYIRKTWNCLIKLKWT